MKFENNFIVIMAGGWGSRFWPESRLQKPKQFLDIFGTGQSMLQTTYLRLKDLCPQDQIYVVTHQNYTEMVREHLPQIPDSNIVAEPYRKNTAPAAAYITYKIYARNKDANILISPADHLIINEQLFRGTALQAFQFVSEYDAIVTLGIKPTRPDTGFGYIQYTLESVTPPVHKVKTFTEKPNLELARTFLKSGDFLWNSGMFVWHVDTFIQAFRKYQSEMDYHFERAISYYNTDREHEIIENIYSQCNTISIDYAVMEKAQNVYVIPSVFGWSDLGTWDAVYENTTKDNYGNALIGTDILIVDSTDNLIKIPNNKLALIQGLNDYIVVNTDNVLLICERGKEQDIKEYVNEIKRKYGENFL